jgi:hypothetical protein
MWNFIIYAGAGSDITNSVDEPDNQRSLKTVTTIHNLCGVYLETVMSMSQAHSKSSCNSSAEA